jgi:hypothetical protein
MQLLFGNAIMKVSFIKGNEAWGYKTKITTPPLVVGLVGEGLNEPHNSQGWNQCGIIMHTQRGEK